MHELLEKHTQMAVQVVEKDLPPKPNRIYLIPHDKNLGFEMGKLRILPREPDNKLNLPIDLFMGQLGEAIKHDAIGVILSGTGTDGSKGARVIKEKGGMVLAQEPSSADFDGMPQSVIRLGLPDEVLTAREIGSRLGYILSPQNEAEERTDAQDEPDRFTEILDLIQAKTGLRLKEYRENTLKRRTEKRMLLRQVETLGEYKRMLEGNPKELNSLYRDFLIGVTQFYRDPDAFKFLARKVIPEIFNRGRSDEPVRIWVPACSTGEEAYTIAFLIQEHLAELDLDLDYKIFASDVDKPALAIASQGIYPNSTVADVPPDVRAKYFVPQKDNHQVKQEVRDHILFAVQDVLNDPPFIRMDVISCRNLLIYIKPSAQRKILTTFHFALKPQSFLMLGSSESLGELKNAFQPIDGSLKIYEKKEDARLPFKPDFSAPVPSELRGSGLASLSLQPEEPRKQARGRWENSDLTQTLLDAYLPTGLVLNPDLEVFYISGPLESLLRLPRAHARLNLYQMMDMEEALLFATGVQMTLHAKGPHHYRNVKLGDQLVQLQFRGFPDDEERVFVEIQFGADGEEAAKNVEIDPKNLDKDHILNLQHDLSIARMRSEKLVSELEATNEELQSSNRELMASNEELQSTNEELQSVNQELFTVNSELQAKNEELQMVNTDISNLLRSTDIGTIFLDSDLCIRRFTPAIRSQFDLVDADMGRPITSFSNPFPGLDLEKLGKEILRSHESFEKDITSRSGQHFLLRILPYRTRENSVKGLVVTFINIDDLAKEKSRLETKLAEFEAFMDHAVHQITLVDKEYKIAKINFTRYSGMTPDKIKGMSILDFVTETDKDPIQAAIDNVFRGEPIVKVNITTPERGGGQSRVSLVGTPVIVRDQVRYVAFISSEVGKT